MSRPVPSRRASDGLWSFVLHTALLGAPRRQVIVEVAGRARKARTDHSGMGPPSPRGRLAQ